MRLEHRGGEHFALHYGDQCLLGIGPDGLPLSLERIDQLTRHLTQIDPVDGGGSCTSAIDLDPVDRLLLRGE
jgi:hypothetical protein